VLAAVSREVMQHLAAGHILDVGCAVGYFLTEFFSSEQWSVDGVELSRQMASIASSRGIKTFAGELRKAGYEESSFDAVTILDAFYYFVDPYAELAEIKRILKSSGVLVIELPNAATRIWRSENAFGRALSHRSGRLLQTSDHIFYYNRRSVSMLLQRAGFTVKCVKGLRSNRQRNSLVNALYGAFDLCCTVLEVISLGRVLLNARFLVVAEPVSP
jgi:SAM-dependent methyltransferase